MENVLVKLNAVISGSQIGFVVVATESAHYQGLV